jgi:putative tricarboxylic transport membrane protein
MKLSDKLSGLLIVLAGLAVVAHAARFPPSPGQPIGPSAFPTMIGIGLVLLGAALAYTGEWAPGASWVGRDEWLHRPRMVLNFVLVFASLFFYSFVVDRAGFFITGFTFLSVLFLAFGVTRAWIAPVAFAVTLLIHYGFYSLLRVPLPWGLLEAIAW